MRIAAVLAAVLAIVSIRPSLGGEPPLKDFLGKWDLFIDQTSSSFSAGALAVFEAEPGRPRAELVWRWGSVLKLSGEAVALADGGLKLSHKDIGSGPLVLRLEDGRLSGAAPQKDGATFKVHGTRGEEPVDPRGIWDVEAIDANGVQTGRGRLEIERGVEAGSWKARAFSDAGEELPVVATELAGGLMTVRFELGPEGEKHRVELEAQLSGERLSGKLFNFNDSGGRDAADVTIRGDRRRLWGEPVKLIAESGLVGWHPRDQSRPFRWSCEGGVLTNGEHDVDIVSDRKFGDFKLELEYKVDQEGANSGVYLRGRYEVQILGNKQLTDHSNGAVYSRIQPSANPFSGAGQWQRFEITVVGRWLTVKLNGQTVIENQRLEGITGGALDSQEHLPGPLMLQGDHGKIHFRNLVVHPAQE
jgi:hypothetical protein